MAYFRDLSPYAYGRAGGMEQADAVNVGWLDSGHAFATGSVPAWLMPGILRLVATARLNLTRGFHRCDLCPAPPYPIEIDIDGHIWPLGDCEIRARSADGMLYAAPSLIAHYIGGHRYLPPVGFIEAIRLTALPS